MNEKTLFQLALGLTGPWFVNNTKFDPAAKRLDLFLDFKRGHAFPCPECRKPGKAYDAEEKTWRHLNFFQHEAFLTPMFLGCNAGTMGYGSWMFSWDAQRADSPSCLRPW